MTSVHERYIRCDAARCSATYPVEDDQSFKEARAEAATDGWGVRRVPLDKRRPFDQCPQHNPANRRKTP